MNEIEIRRFLELLHPADDALIEVRIMDKNKTYSGYFKNKSKRLRASAGQALPALMRQGVNGE